MDKEILKSSPFGYSKISVCQYIATMNEEFNAKLMAEADFFCEEYSKQQKKIDDLEAELAVHKQNACDVGTMLRSRSKNETDQFFLEFKAKGQAQTQKLALYTGAIVKIWEDMAILANRTDDALNTFAEYFLSLR